MAQPQQQFDDDMETTRSYTSQIRMGPTTPAQRMQTPNRSQPAQQHFSASKALLSSAQKSGSSGAMTPRTPRGLHSLSSGGGTVLEAPSAEEWAAHQAGLEQMMQLLDDMTAEFSDHSDESGKIAALMEEKSVARQELQHKRDDIRVLLQQLQTEASELDASIAASPVSSLQASQAALLAEQEAHSSHISALEAQLAQAGQANESLCAGLKSAKPAAAQAAEAQQKARAAAAKMHGLYEAATCCQWNHDAIVAAGQKTAAGTFHFPQKQSQQPQTKLPEVVLKPFSLPAAQVGAFATAQAMWDIVDKHWGFAGAANSAADDAENAPPSA